MRTIKEDDDATVLFIQKSDLQRFPAHIVQHARDFNADFVVLTLPHLLTHELTRHQDPIVRRTVYYSKNNSLGIISSEFRTVSLFQ
jgi:hypothetical protein